MLCAIFSRTVLFTTHIVNLPANSVVELMVCMILDCFVVIFLST